MSDQAQNAVDARPVWLKRCIVVFVAIFLFRFISFWLELLFIYLHNFASEFIYRILVYEEVIVIIASVGISVLIGFLLEKRLLRRKKATNIVFLVLFVVLALNSIHFSSKEVQFLFPDELSKEFNEYIENAGTVLPVSIEYRAVLSEPDGSTPYTLKDTEESLYLSDQVVIDETHFVRVYVEPAITGEGFDIQISLNEVGAEKMIAFTKANIDKRLAIVIDGELVNAPVIRSVIAYHMRLGNLSKEQAFDVTARLESMINE